MQKYLNALRSRISHITKAQVYHVPPQTIPMRESNERRLVHTMIQEYNARVRTSTVDASETELPIGSLLTKDYVSYTGVFLDHTSRRLLKKNVRCPTGWSKTDHHMTLTLGPATAEELDLCIGAQLGETVELVVDGLGTISNAVIAVRVALARVQGKGMTLVPQVVGTTPHITIGYNEPAGFKPSYANNIKAWRPLRSGDLVLRGVVGEKMLTTATIIAPEVPGQVPDEVSVGSLVCQRWPMLKGRDIGVAVGNARLRMETQGVENVESNRGKIVDIVNGLFCA
ncbi:hypothetical protein LPJ66_011748 [Kickxella alabastrina]|uniref:Uncharacterized protein n=1 Tax=Kickxella alabastrina TaxID=61397 RepID=A0ACC1I2T0_9FUNG|nr:hypothetical protein LPJ66_011748 [Kickxella alabastrina]